MLKHLTLSAALLTLLSPAARATGLMEAFATASAAAGKFQANLCSDNKELEKVVFRFKLDGAKGSDSLDVRFSFVSCDVEDDHERTPSAVRVYQGDVAGYKLVLETAAGGTDTLAVLTKNDVVTGSLGSYSKASLLNDTLSIKIADLRSGSKKLAGQAVFFSYDPNAKPAPAADGPKGCQ